MPRSEEYPRAPERLRLISAVTSLSRLPYWRDAPVIRTTCTVKLGAGQRASGQLRYVTRVSGQLVSGRYPFVMTTADQFHVDKLEFLDRSHPTFDLRPKSPLEVTFGFYSPDITFCYPWRRGTFEYPTTRGLILIRFTPPKGTHEVPIC